MLKFLTAACLTILAMTQAHAQGGYTVSAPTIKGGGATINLTVTIPGVIPPGQKSDTNNVPVHLVGASNGNPGETAATKAAKIVAAINSFYGCPQTGPTTCASIDPHDSSRINIVSNNPRSTDLNGHELGGTISIHDEGTQHNASEPQLQAVLNNAPGGGVIRPPHGQIGFTNPPAGVDGNGAASQFTASFGYDGLDLSASVTDSGLADPSLDGILTNMFNQFESELPVGLRPDLTIDLTNQFIDFAFPFDQTNYFVDVATTDTGTGAVGGLIEVPEPGPVMLIAVGLAGLALARRRRN